MSLISISSLFARRPEDYHQCPSPLCEAAGGGDDPHRVLSDGVRPVRAPGVHGPVEEQVHHVDAGGGAHELDHLGDRLQPLVPCQRGAGAVRQRQRRQVRRRKCNLSPARNVWCFAGDFQSLTQWHFINVYVK